MSRIDRCERSPLKWLGGKYNILNEILGVFPKTVKNFYEPFFGGGNVGLNVRHRLDVEKCIFGDTNEHLINFWLALKEHPTEFFHESQLLFVDSNNNDTTYRSLKHEFNTTQDKFRKSVLFLYLNKHCFNGLCRFNSSGKFNTPFGDNNSPALPIREMENAHLVLANCDLRHCAFQDLFKEVDNNDAVYCDPPYLPLSKTANFTKYAQDGFSYDDQVHLAACCYEAAQKGATVVISNHDTPAAREIYKNATDHLCINVNRNISRDGDNRKSATEIIFIYYPYNIITNEKQRFDGEIQMGGEFFNFSPL